jgi:hypothetical protein
MSKIILRNKSNHLTDKEAMKYMYSCMDDIGNSDRYVRYINGSKGSLRYGISLVRNSNSYTFIVWDSRRTDEEKTKTTD